MRKAFKKAIAVLLVTVMVFGSSPLAGFVGLDLPEFSGFKRISDSVSEFFDGFATKAKAATEYTDGYYTYTVDDNGNATITDVDSSISGDITIPSTLGGYPVTNIGGNAFSYCDFTSITIPDSVTSIGDYAFYSCGSLASITIPDCVTSIGDYAFYSCGSLASITIPDSITSIGDYAFAGCGFGYTNVTIPGSVISIGHCAFAGCDRLTGITVDPANTFYSSDEYGVLFNKNKTVLIQCPMGLTKTNYIVPNSVTSIGDYAFYYCHSLTSITIPDSVTSIGGHAFSCCHSLANITIPDSVTNIGYGAFYNCDNLLSVTIENGVTYISDSMFGSCENLTSVIIPNSITSIGYGAFNTCTGLTNITIGDGVTRIGTDAFSYCYRLRDVYYIGTEEAWNTISIRTGNQNLQNATIYYSYCNTDQEQTKKMSVFTNNMSLSYFKGDKIYFSVTEIEDGIWNIPENIIVTSSDNSILKFEQMGKKDWFKHFLISFAPTKYEKLKSYMSAIIPKAFEDCKFICFEAINPGNAVVTITNNDTGEKVEIPISVSDDKYYSLRADRVPENDWSLEILGKEVEHDIYNYNVNGMMVTDFEYTEIGNAYNFKMNIYNRKYSSGVVEVYDENYNLIEVHKISGRDTSTTGLVETFEAGWGLVKSISDYDMLSFRAPHQTKHTPIDIKVPKGGGIIITNDSAASTSCFLFNLFDAALSTRSLISDVQSLPEGQIDIIEKKLLENLIADKVRMELADSLKEKAADLVLEDISDAAVKSLIKSIDQIIYEYMESLDIDLNEICKTAVKETGGELIEDVFGKYAGPAGATINALFMGEKFREFYIKILDWTDTIGTQCTEGILTPLDKDYEEGLISSVDGISVDTKNNVPSETILQTIRLYDGYNELNIRNLSTEYVIRDYKTYDISLVRNGEKVQPSGNVELYIPVPHGFEHVRVARQNDDGTWTSLNTKVRNGIAIVEVDHFCMFVILDVDIDEMANPILTIRTPSTTTISYGDAIILHADVQNLPAGATIKWTASNDNFDFDVRDNGASCKITPSSSGDTIFTATVYDANNKVVSEDTQEMTSKAGFFDKIIAFFKKLFGLTKTIPEVFKF